MKRIILLLGVLLSTLSISFAAETADAVLRKAASRISSGEGISASFTLDSDGRKVSGTLKAEGKKLAIETGSSSTWYDGKTMWTYNPRTAETTVMLPTAQEVAEANPLSIINNYAATFTASFAKTQTKGSKTIVLSPKSKKSGYKSVYVTIPDGSGLPSLIVINPQSGRKITVSIAKAALHNKFAASTFTYPKAKYPKAEIIDLR